MIKIPKLTSLKLSEIFNAKFNGKNVDFSYISLNSKEKSKEGFCFFAINGEKFNGADFINESIDNGATVVVTQEKIKSSKAQIICVNDTKKALGLLVRYLKGNWKTIGITGSNGKTTTKEMLSLIFSEKYRVNSTYKNNNNEIGVPLSILNDLNAEIHIIEMGMRGFGEIDWLSYICEPDISIITNVGSSHIGRLKSFEALVECKLEILNHTKKYAVLPIELKEYLKEPTLLDITFCGKDANAYIKNYILNQTGIDFSVEFNGEIIDNLHLNSFFIHNLYNALNAICVAKIYKLSNLDIRNGLLKYKGKEMREEYQSINGITVINDCYNASFESMKSAIISLKEYSKIKNKKPYALLGDMLELGEYSREFHYRIGELARDVGIKNLFIQGKYAPEIADGFSGGIICQDKKEIAKKIALSLGKQDVILIKASRNMNFELIIKELLKYD